MRHELTTTAMRCDARVALYTAIKGRSMARTVIWDAERIGSLPGNRSSGEREHTLPHGWGWGGGAGTLRSSDPDRINLKKIVLTGFPVKVHKTKAVVRWMFNCPEDVLWFRPLDLFTKYGRRGRIKVRRGQPPPRWAPHGRRTHFDGWNTRLAGPLKALVLLARRV